MFRPLFSEQDEDVEPSLGLRILVTTRLLAYKLVVFIGSDRMRSINEYGKDLEEKLVGERARLCLLAEPLADSCNSANGLFGLLYFW